MNFNLLSRSFRFCLDSHSDKLYEFSLFSTIEHLLPLFLAMLKDEVKNYIVKHTISLFNCYNVCSFYSTQVFVG